MPRIRAVLEYDGTGYRGWQRQPDASTVQCVCERAIREVLGEETAVIASGRTDTGVHARGQTVHLDHPGRIGPDELRKAWNARLPDDVWVAGLEVVDDDFHARHDAVRRTYRYHVAIGPRAESPFRRRFAWPLRREPVWERTATATDALVGTHDFHRFAKGVGPPSDDDETPPGRCTVFDARWRPSPKGRILEITADRYLRHMVRAIVGALVAIGHGRLEPDAIDLAFGPTGRRLPAAYAPPEGLFLWKVEYER